MGMMQAKPRKTLISHNNSKFDLVNHGQHVLQTFVPPNSCILSRFFWQEKAWDPTHLHIAKNLQCCAI